MATPYGLYLEPKTPADFKYDTQHVQTVDDAIKAIQTSQAEKKRIEQFYINEDVPDAEVQRLNDWLCNNVFNLPVRIMWTGSESRKPLVRHWQQQIANAVNGKQFDTLAGAMMAVPIQVAATPLPEKWGNNHYRITKKPGQFVSQTYWEKSEPKIQDQWDQHVHSDFAVSQDNSGNVKTHGMRGKINGSIAFVNTPQMCEQDALHLAHALHEPGNPPVAVPFLTKLTRAQALLDMAAGIRTNIKFITAAPADELAKMNISNKEQTIKELDEEATKYIAEAHKLTNDGNANEVAWVVGAHYQP